ncbi:hypothetical protein P3X46_002615 [Hevea brasiliensis]|uniref:Aspartic peptidase DDI1-type domain-containing protein n=1 Tax=Hevea brasiliensis TaxID=3981 RepID=A0ABQ9N4C7_HEVBR|nr:hypothetical protein P3X46_002615 [Hevea brasiliensis]
MKPEIASQRDRKKYYRFHKDHGHTMNKCRKLKDEIERLIRDGTLRRFTSDRNKDQGKTNPEELIEIINVIIGGLDAHKANGKKVAESSCLKNVLSVERENLCKDSISFESMDYENIKRPHSNPLVVNILLNKYMVHRVLVDTESSINLVTLKVHKKFDLKRSDLTKVILSLVGLSDKIVPVAGTTNLIVVLGDKAFKRSIYTEFFVVDIPLSYNLILGRLILNGNNILINMDCKYETFSFRWNSCDEKEVEVSPGML